MSEYRVSSRYAKSLIELAQEKNLLDQVKNDMVLFRDTCDQSRDLSLMLKSPIISHIKKAEILKSLFEGKVNELTFSFIDIVCKKTREFLLYPIAKQFLHQYNEVKGIQKATVISSTPLTVTAREAINKVVSEVTGKTVELEEKVDESLIGGYVLRVGDKQIDDSVKSRLKNLRAELSA
ncbi:MAG: ATP synthase F1 subunit delta [Flammeovirgaceae bacterium]